MNLYGVRSGPKTELMEISPKLVPSTWLNLDALKAPLNTSARGLIRGFIIALIEIYVHYRNPVKAFNVLVYIVRVFPSTESRE